MRLANKVVCVTGSTKGIGKSIARYLAKEGASVVVSGRSEADGLAVVESILTEGGKACWIQADVSRAADCRALIDGTVQAFGRIDGLVNNAGVFPHIPLPETDEETFDRVMDTNAKGTFFCIQQALVYMQKTGGSIVNIGSTHWNRGAYTLPAYGMSKGAIRTLTSHVSFHYGRYGVRCNWISVGWVLSEGEVERHLADGHDWAWINALAKKCIPSGKFQTGEDMGAACCFLLSDEASQVTDTDIAVTGGFMMERLSE